MAPWHAKSRTTARGYGAAHQAERARWKPIVDAGQGWCAETICLRPTRWISPAEPWDLAHTPDRTSYAGVSHRQCNRSDGATRGNRMRGQQRAAQAGRRRQVTIAPAPLRTSRNW